MNQLTNKLLAKIDYTLTGPGVAVADNNAATTKLENLISTLFGFLTLIGVIYFTIQIIFSGYAFISSQGDKDKLKIARNRLTNSILGLTVVVIAFGAGAFIAKLAGLNIKTIFDLNSFFNSLK